MTLYLVYAVRRFGLRDGLRRFVEFSVWPILILRGPRRAFRRWRRKDRRPKARGVAGWKWAVKRDGDYGLVECPVCHDQGIWFDREKRVFACRGGSGHRFRVYLEDGIVKLHDHRRGDLRHFPATAVYDDSGKVYRLGIADDAPWWWMRKEVYRDLRPDGKDGHGHKAYEVLPPEPAEEEQLSSPRQPEKEIR